MTPQLLFEDTHGYIIEDADEHEARLAREEEDMLLEDLALLHLPGAHDDWGCD